jgi:hypothetical protein
VRATTQAQPSDSASPRAAASTVALAGNIGVPPKGPGRYRLGSSVTTPTRPTRTARVSGPVTSSTCEAGSDGEKVGMLVLSQVPANSRARARSDSMGTSCSWLPKHAWVTGTALRQSTMPAPWSRLDKRLGATKSPAIVQSTMSTPGASRDRCTSVRSRGRLSRRYTSLTHTSRSVGPRFIRAESVRPGRRLPQGVAFGVGACGDAVPSRA